MSYDRPVNLAVSTVDLARVQFATTSLYHFLFVPLTLGLAPLVAAMQTLWTTRTRRGCDWRASSGRSCSINFAIGVATGLVQEFQFGMNWSVYSKFVGDVFGAPLAIEGLAAFMLESTFLGLWIFGWDRLSRRVHLATIWLFALGSWPSATSSSSRTRGCSGRSAPTSSNGRASSRASGQLLSTGSRLGVHPRDPRRADDRRGPDLRRRLLALPARAEPGAVPPGGDARAARRRPGLRA